MWVPAILPCDDVNKSLLWNMLFSDSDITFSVYCQCFRLAWLYQSQSWFEREKLNVSQEKKLFCEGIQLSLCLNSRLRIWVMLASAFEMKIIWELLIEQVIFSLSTLTGCPSRLCFIFTKFETNVEMFFRFYCNTDSLCTCIWNQKGDTVVTNLWIILSHAGYLTAHL